MLIGRAGIMQTMLLPARPTLRCLREDLAGLLDGQAKADAETVGKKDGLPASAVDHPVLQKARAAFPLSGAPSVKRETLSSGRGHPWWKLKVAEWRGAAHEDPETGQVWVCAVGLKRDFYTWFSDVIARKGHSYLLPTDEDRALLKRERASAIIRIWESELHASALIALDDAIGTSRPVTVPVSHPTDGRVLSECDISVFRMPDEVDGIVEITVSFGRDQWQDSRLIDRAEEVILAAIDPQEQDWRPGSLANGTQTVFSQLVTDEPFEVFLARAKYRRAPGTTTAGSQSHYTDDAELTRKTVEGEAVEAICGAWFVPRQDHASLETCSVCDAGLRQIPA
jgi:hypothetical protein